jgi:hypothetical protein
MNETPAKALNTKKTRPIVERPIASAIEASIPESASEQRLTAFAKQAAAICSLETFERPATLTVTSDQLTLLVHVFRAIRNDATAASTNKASKSTSEVTRKYPSKHL